MSVLPNYQVADAEFPIDVLTAQQAYDNARNLDDLEQGQLAIVAHSGSDGIAVIGTATELRDWLHRVSKRLDEVTAPDAGYATHHLCDDECGDDSHPRDGRIVPVHAEQARSASMSGPWPPHTDR